MSLAVDKQVNYTTIATEVDKLDTFVAPDLKAQFVVLDKDGVKNYIIDLSSARYCDSSGLSALLVGNRLAKAAEGKFIICGLQPAVEKLIQISQLHTVLEITKTLEEAVEKI